MRKNLTATVIERIKPLRIARRSPMLGAKGPVSRRANWRL